MGMGKPRLCHVGNMQSGQCRRISHTNYFIQALQIFQDDILCHTKSLEGRHSGVV